MANTVKFLDDRFIAMSGIGMAQVDKNTPLADAVIDTRLKCRIALEDNIERQVDRDCENVDRTGERIRTRYRRVRLTFEAVTAQLYAMLAAYHFGTASVTGGPRTNEVQTITRTGTISSGYFTLALTLEGRTAVTKPIAWDATITEIQNKLTAARMKWIQPGDIVVTGTWGGGMVLTFGERLSGANLALMVIDPAPAGVTALGGGGSLGIAQTTAGGTYYHEITRAVSREKIPFGFALGYIDGSADPQKFSSFVSESFTPSGSRRQNASLEFSMVGPYEPEEMTGYTIPDCENPDPMLSEDIKVLINGEYQTTDVSTLTAPFNDNVALDDSAYGWDGIDPDLFARAKQIDYDVNAQIFSTEADAIGIIAENERTADPVDAKYHFGLPGDRFTLLAPETKVKFQSGEHFVAVGASERIAGNYNLSAYKNDQDPPVSAEAYIAQSVAFLTTS